MPDRLAEQDRRVLPLPEDRAQRLGDLAGTERRRSRPGRAAAGTGGSCGDRRASRRRAVLAERARRVQAAEAAADDHDAVGTAAACGGAHLPGRREVPTLMGMTSSGPGLPSRASVSWRRPVPGWLAPSAAHDGHWLWLRRVGSKPSPAAPGSWASNVSDAGSAASGLLDRLRAVIDSHPGCAGDLPFDPRFVRVPSTGAPGTDGDTDARRGRWSVPARRRAETLSSVSGAVAAIAAGDPILVDRSARRADPEKLLQRPYPHAWRRLAGSGNER